MSDRLDELRRQRALLQEHLAWMDREIAALTRAAPSPTAAPPPRPPPVVAALAPPPRTPAAPLPDFSQYEPDAASMQSDAKRGCLMYAVAGLVLFFALLTGIYFFGYRDHPLFRAEKPARVAPQK